MQIPIPPQYKEPAPEPEAPRNPRKGLLIASIIGAVVVVLLAAMFLWGVLLKNGDTIYPNVYIEGIDVGGLSRAQAMDAVGDAVTQAYDSSVLAVKLPDRTISFLPEQTHSVLDTRGAVDVALAYGRQGNPFLAVTAYWSALGKNHTVSLLNPAELDTGYIRQVIDQVAKEASLDPAPSEITYNEKTKTILVEVGYPDRELDADGLYEAVCNAFREGNFSPIQWDYDEVPCAPVDLEGFIKKYGTEMKDAVYDEETGDITEEVVGFGFDVEAEATRLAEAQPGSKVTIRMEDMIPEVTKAELDKQYFGTKLFSKSTVYVVNANRTNNLKLACEAINGTVLSPGEVFSFNDIVGERTAEKGYLPATVYSGGESLPELGGGVCQVASTIYYATLHMDLEQVERTEHMFVVTYVDMGMDATIYWGSLDYKFKNTLDYPIKIQANIDDGSCNITFWGAEPLEKKVEMSYTILSTTPWEEVEEVDETKEPGFREEKHTPYTGYKVVTYKKVFDSDGKELSSGVEAYSTYEKRDHVFIVGPTEEEELPGLDDPLIPADPLNPDSEWYPDTEYPGIDDPLVNPWSI